MNSEPINLGTTADRDLAGEAGRSGSSPAIFDVARIQPTRVVFNKYGPSGNRRVHWEVFPAIHIPILE